MTKTEAVAAALHEQAGETYNNTVHWSVEDSIDIAEGLIDLIRADVDAMKEGMTAHASDQS